MSNLVLGGMGSGELKPKHQYPLLVEALLGHEVALVGLIDVAALSEQPRPQLHPDNPEDEEDEEAEEKNISQHGQCVQQQHHQDPHAWKCS